MFYESREAVTKLFDNHSSIVSEAKYKAILEKEIPSMLACTAHVVCVAKVSTIRSLIIQISKY